MRLVEVRDALEEARQLQLLNRLPARGKARQLLLTLLRQDRDNLAGRITEELTRVAPLGDLARELVRELSCQLPQDLQGLLAEWNGHRRVLNENAKKPRVRSAAPPHQNLAVLEFMVFWEHQLRTGASRHGQPEHYELPEEGEPGNDRAALKLLRACCSGYWEAEKTILGFFDAGPARQIPIVKAMDAILVRAREAAACDVLFDGSPPTDENLPTAETEAPEDAPTGHDAERASAAPTAPPAGAIGEQTPPQATHNSDFTMVCWFGTEYSFALGVQSSAVKALWAEWAATGLGLHQETIRDAIDPERDSFRMDTAFRNHPALGAMIQRCGDGRYKLAPPGTQVTPPPPKARRGGKNARKSRRKRG
jgi:hypothetical protein